MWGNVLDYAEITINVTGPKAPAAPENIELKSIQRGFSISLIFEGLAYQYPANVDKVEIYVSKTSGFNPKGWSGTAWNGAPNNPLDWDGETNNLYAVNKPSNPLIINDLIPGTTYYIKVVNLDTFNQRSVPSEEKSGIPLDVPRSSTYTVAASDSNYTNSGADYICNGTSDQDTINAAINNLPSGGGTITLTEGTFVIDGPVNLISNMILQGQGKNTIIKLQNNSSNAYMIYGNEISGSQIRDLVIDGNKTNISVIEIDGILINNCNDITLYGVHVREARRHGIVIDGASSQISISKSNIHNNFWRGISGTMINSLISDNMINNNIDGIHVYDSRGMTVSNNTVFENTLGVGIRMTYSSNGSINNNVSHDNGEDGIIIVQSSNNNIIGNNCYANGASSAQVFDVAQIMVQGFPSEYNAIQHNICRVGDNQYKAKYGIRINDNECRYTLISSNDCYQSGTTAGVSNAGTNTNFGAGNRNNNGTWSATPN